MTGRRFSGKRAITAIPSWFASTPHRTFILYPAVVIALALAIHGEKPLVNPWGAPLLFWGYLQYQLVGRYRIVTGGGGPGTAVPPVHLVTAGPYRIIRNPMYLGHLIFLLGLAVTFRSWLGLALFLFHIVWFQRRVLQDEARLQQIFGEDYRDYLRRTPRWIPGLSPAQWLVTSKHT